jgi:hypothetical protein
MSSTIAEEINKLERRFIKSIATKVLIPVKKPAYGDGNTVPNIIKGDFRRHGSANANDQTARSSDLDMSGETTSDSDQCSGLSSFPSCASFNSISSASFEAMHMPDPLMSTENGLEYSSNDWETLVSCINEIE